MNNTEKLLYIGKNEYYRAAAKWENQDKGAKQETYRIFVEELGPVLADIMQNYKFGEPRPFQIYQRDDLVEYREHGNPRGKELDFSEGENFSRWDSIYFRVYFSINPNLSEEAFANGMGKGFTANFLIPTQSNSSLPHTYIESLNQLKAFIVDLYFYLLEKDPIGVKSPELKSALDKRLMTGDYAKTTVESVLSIVNFLFNSYAACSGKYTFLQIAESPYFAEATAFMLRGVNADLGRQQIWPADGGMLETEQGLVMSPGMRKYLVALNKASLIGNPQTTICPFAKAEKLDLPGINPIQAIAIWLGNRLDSDIC